MILLRPLKEVHTGLLVLSVLELISDCIAVSQLLFGALFRSPSKLYPGQSVASPGTSSKYWGRKLWDFAIRDFINLRIKFRDFVTPQLR